MVTENALQRVVAAFKQGHSPLQHKLYLEANAVIQTARWNLNHVELERAQKAMNMLGLDFVVLAAVTSPLNLAESMVFTRIIPMRTSARILAKTLLNVWDMQFLVRLTQPRIDVSYTVVAL